MMIRAAGADAHPADRPVLEAFLLRHADSTMFLRSNLGRGPFWIWGDGVPRGALGLSPAGSPRFLAVQMEEEPDWASLRRMLAGQEVAGMNGPEGQVARLRDGLGLGAVPTEHDAVDPLYALALAELTVPSGAGTLAPATEVDLPLLYDWRAAYLCEVLGAPQGAKTVARAAAEARRMLDAGHVRLLWAEGVPVAMTNFNAALPDMVQIGGVFTPPELRGRGHARRAVALQLCEARERGVVRAVLFAASVGASRAYEAVGFRHVGAYHLLVFAAPARIAP